MIAVIFEFTAPPERRQDYLELAAELNALVRDFDGNVLRDYGIEQRAQAPADSAAFHSRVQG